MGKLNLLKGAYEGKVGQTVGAKWKNKSTVRTFTKPSDPKTQAQMDVRNAFAAMTSFVALFADQIKYISPLSTAGMSVRNAIIKQNKAQIQGNAFDPANLVIAKGGLQKPSTVTAAKEETSNVIKATFAKPTATNFTKKAIAVLVAVDKTNQVVDVATGPASEGSVTGTIAFVGTGKIDTYLYFLDYRGTAKVGSLSVYTAIGG